MYSNSIAISTESLVYRITLVVYYIVLRGKSWEYGYIQFSCGPPLLHERAKKDSGPVQGREERSECVRIYYITCEILRFKIDKLNIIVKSLKIILLFEIDDKEERNEVTEQRKRSQILARFDLCGTRKAMYVVNIKITIKQK